MRSRIPRRSRPPGLLLPVVAAIVVVLTLADSSVQAAEPAQSSLRVAIDGHSAATMTSDHRMFLESVPERKEGLLAFTERFCGSVSWADQIAEVNGGARRLLRGVRYRVPYACLLPNYREKILKALFPDDVAVSSGWRHLVRRDAGGQLETLWSIARWSTGNGENYREIRAYNQLKDETITPGQSIVVPVHLLLPVFRQPIEDLAAERSKLLTYGRDARGEHAVYSLRSGEALYSSVVMRFTGRLFGSDVNPLAEEIAARSDIADVTDIPVGYEVKIPFEYLSPEFLPPEHPRRRQYEANLSASRKFMNQVSAIGLTGVTVILDAGHGGKDSGAQNRGIWESLYVYDIMLRVRNVLLETTGAEVHTTTRDGDAFRIEDRDQLSFSQRHTVLVTPPYGIEAAQIGTHLRWYLANDMLARQTENGTDPKRVVFISIHADSLHPSVRGAMVYVPGLLPIPTSYGKTGSAYQARREVRSRPRVSFSKGERVRSEGLSRDLAGHLIEGFRAAGLSVHPNKPVRDRIVRHRGRPWVPAVLRYNAVPAKVLVEVCNLANPDDLALVQTRAFRERVAQSVVDGLLSYYGYRRDTRPQVAGIGDTGR